MNSDQTLQNESLYPSNTTPHFDEEWTLLTARPVVPLNEVKSQTRRRVVWKLVGAFAIALVLGASVALVSVGLSDSTQAISEESNAVPEQMAATEPSPVPSVPIVVFETQEPEITPTLAAKAPATLTQKEKRPARHLEKPKPAAYTEVDDQDEDSLESFPQQRVIDRFEERRMRRVSRQQRRDRAANRRGDLLRIGDLFEGRRPQ